MRSYAVRAFNYLFFLGEAAGDVPGLEVAEVVTFCDAVKGDGFALVDVLEYLVACLVVHGRVLVVR